MPLLLWDIDGTLIRGGGVGSAAMNTAAELVLGRPLTGEPVMMHGKTDPQILAELFRAADVAEHVIPELLPPTLAEAERLMANAEAELRARGGVVDGVEAVLERMDSTAGVRQTVLTGNLVGNDQPSSSPRSSSPGTSTSRSVPTARTTPTARSWCPSRSAASPGCAGSTTTRTTSG